MAAAARGAAELAAELNASGITVAVKAGAE